MSDLPIFRMTLSATAVLLVLFFLSLPHISLAQGGTTCGSSSCVDGQIGRSVSGPSLKYTPLAGIPGLATGGDIPKLDVLVNSLYRLAIIVGALYGVVRLAVAGIKYMSTDSIGSKSGAREDIKNVLFGLLILLAAVLIIETILGTIQASPFAALKPIDQTMTGTITPVIPPTSTQTGVAVMMKPEDGCQSNNSLFKEIGLTSGETSCKDAGKEIILTGTQIKCAPKGSEAVPGQDTFKYVTQSQCEGASSYRVGVGFLGMAKDISENKEILGYVELSNLPRKTDGSRMSEDEYAKSIEAACKAIDSTATVKNYNPGLFGSYKFGCVK